MGSCTDWVSTLEPLGKDAVSASTFTAAGPSAWNAAFPAPTSTHSETPSLTALSQATTHTQSQHMLPWLKLTNTLVFVILCIFFFFFSHHQDSQDGTFCIAAALAPSPTEDKFEE